MFLQVLDAVRQAHAHGIIHRDLKPSNILVTDQGEVRLLDFGVASLLQAGTSPRSLTRIYGRALTPEYASPELLRGQPVDVRSDIYSLGAVLHELLTGARPGKITPERWQDWAVERRAARHRREGDGRSADGSISGRRVLRGGIAAFASGRSAAPAAKSSRPLLGDWRGRGAGGAVRDGLGAVDAFFGGFRTASGCHDGAQAEAATIAVLPFVDLSEGTGPRLSIRRTRRGADRPADQDS